MDKPLISVIVCAYNAEKTLKKCLDSLLGQDRSDYEIIVADDGSTDRTTDILREYAGKVQVVRLDRCGPSVARNRAVEQAEGEFIAFIDSDCIAAADWLSRLQECFPGRDIVSAGGSQRSPDDETLFGRQVQDFLADAGFIAEYARQSSAVRRVAHNPSCNVMYRSAAFRELGGFVPGFWPGEDVEFDLRVRRKQGAIVFTPHALVYHYRPQDAAGFRRMMRRYGWAQGVLARRYGLFRPVQYVPLFLAALVAAAVWRPAIAAAAVLAMIAFVIVRRWKRSSVRLAIPALWPWHAGFFRGLFVRLRDRS